MKKLATTWTVGMDLGDRHCHLHILDEDGETLEESRVPAKRDSLRRRFESLPGPVRVVLEVGTHSRWIAALLEELGHEVVVANPRRVKLISESHRKSDRVDAEMLARFGRLDPELLSPITHRGPECAMALSAIRARDVAVRARGSLINCVRGQVKSSGSRLRSCSTASFHKLVDELPPELRPVLEPLMRSIADLTATIGEYAREIERIGQEHFPVTELLRQVAGVGPVVALTFAATIESPERFGRNREVGAYLGLVPRRDQSGQVDKELPITKAGDPLLRRLLVQSASYILGAFGPDTDLRRWGLALKERGGAGASNRARIAVARKLSVLLLSLWRSGQTYEPIRQA